MVAGYAIPPSVHDHEVSDSIHPLTSIKMDDGRPKSMRRRISVGLPMHNRHRTTSQITPSYDHSRITQYLLETFQHRPLLHSILVEKDSRRIFYFMWYVGSITNGRECSLTHFAQLKLLIHARTTLLWLCDKLFGTAQRQHSHVL